MQTLSVLCRTLAAVANPVRLSILERLQSAKTLSEIRITSDRRGGRILSRQSIKRHLDRLMEAGLVVARDAGPGRAGPEYVLDPRGLASLPEAIERIAPLWPATPEIKPGRQSTSKARPACLVPLNGMQQGHPLSLEPYAQASCVWRIGRHCNEIVVNPDGVECSDAATIAMERGTYRISSQEGPTDPATLNFRALPAGEAVPLAHGDLIGIDGCLLLFRIPPAGS